LHNLGESSKANLKISYQLQFTEQKVKKYTFKEYSLITAEKCLGKTEKPNYKGAMFYNHYLKSGNSAQHSTG